MPDDPPRTKDGAVIPPEWFDNEPSLLTEDQIKEAYDADFEERMRKYVEDLNAEASK